VGHVGRVPRVPRVPRQTGKSTMKNNNQNTKGLIPKHWQLKKLGEVCTYSKGKKPAILKETITKESTVPYINIKAFEKGIISEYTDGVKCTICNDDDLLMVWDGARCGLIGKAKKGAVGSTLMKIIPNENIHKEYLYHFISSKFWTLNTKPKGVGIPHIEPTLLWNFELVLPPLLEQIAIVAKIEELLSELENGKKQLQTAKQQLKVYRQSLLKAAFEGKLTNENINEGIKELKNEKIKNGELPKGDALSLPKGWKMVKTGDVIDVINNGYTPKSNFLTEGSGEIPFIKVYNLNFNGTLNFKKNPTFIPEAVHKMDLKRSICFPGDVLINIVGPPLGKVSVITNQYPEWNINQAIVMFRPNERVISKYIKYFLLNPVTINWLEGTSKATAGQWNVKVSTCREIPMPLPPIKEQHLIVSELESKLTVCDKIEETISQSLQQAEALRQSILKKAFEGELIKE
jgi:type I restriction enzyme S subunit